MTQNGVLIYTSFVFMTNIAKTRLTQKVGHAFI